ncbi:MAG: hypothetical protein RH917_07855 [Lacipirellulaceae bacterium]
MNYSAGWRIHGVVSETRELKSPKNPDWRGYLAKVQTLGSTHEITCEDQAQWSTLQQLKGQAALLGGEFETVKGALKLILKTVEKPSNAK